MSEAINRGLHQVNEFECRVTRDVGTKEVVQQPPDLPTPGSSANRMHALGFSLNLVLQSDRLNAVTERRVAFVTSSSIPYLHSSARSL